MNKKSFPLKQKLLTAAVEKDVENIYRECFSSHYGTENIEISSPFGCDGYLTKKNSELFIDLPEDGYRKNSIGRLKVLFEFKYDNDFDDAMERAKVILQCIFYIKQFELNGKDIEAPNIIFIGDINEMFVLHYNSIQKYLGQNLDWNVAPSKAANKYPNIVLDIVTDADITPYVVGVSDDGFDDVVEYIEKLNENTRPHIRITQHNLERIYFDFAKNILGKHENVRLKSEAIVGIFIGCITNPEDYYLHPKKKNTLVTPFDLNVSIVRNKFESFFSFFNAENYSIEEKRTFTEIQDRLIEDLSRRKQGEYFTPTIWADKANSFISDCFGADWRDVYTVWDCACGTKNLTRDYSFKKLFCSTIHESDLDISKNYNSRNISFKYDFLQDDIVDGIIDNNTSKAHPELVKAIKNDDPILFFINPPYGTATADGAKGDGSKKKGMSITQMNTVMNAEGFGYASQQLYAQFMARIMKFKINCNLSNVKIAIFAPPIYLSSSAFRAFREIFSREFKYNRGFIFSANHFADVSANWGISFTIWDSTNNGKSENEYLMSQLDANEKGIVEVGDKTIYNTDGCVSGSDWVKSSVGKKIISPTIPFPFFSSAIQIKQEGRGTIQKNALGFYNNGGNNIYQSEGQVGIYSGPFSNGNGYSITDENFDRVISNFIARRFGFSYENWANQKDEFLQPNTSHEKYDQYLNDAYVLAAFNPKNKASSLRQVDYSGSKFDIINNFFYMDSIQIKELANTHGNETIYSDIIAFPGERYLFNKIKAAQLSKSAKQIYEYAIMLTKESFKYRDALSEEYADYNLNAWDAGWFQVKFVIDKFMKEKLSEFEKQYLEFFKEQRELVFELGFLKK